MRGGQQSMPTRATLSAGTPDFKKVLTRKFERLAKGKGNAIKPVSPVT